MGPDGPSNDGAIALLEPPSNAGALSPPLSLPRRNPSVHSAALLSSNDHGWAPSRTLHFRDHLYATLDNQDPDAPKRHKHVDFIPMPDGWGLSPGDPPIVSHVIACHSWSTLHVITSCGHSWCTRLGVKPGQAVASGRLECSGRRKYRPSHCAGNARILIRRRVTKDDVIDVPQQGFEEITSVCDIMPSPEHSLLAWFFRPACLSVRSEQGQRSARSISRSQGDDDYEDQDEETRKLRTSP